MTEQAALPSEVPPVSRGLTSWIPRRVVADLAHPFNWAFTAAVAVMVAVALGAALASLSTVLISVGVALFVALALDPLVLRMEKRGVSRGLAIGIVFTVFAVVIGCILAFVVPSVIGQVVAFAQAVPGYLRDLQQTPWFQSLLAGTSGGVFFTSALAAIEAWLTTPANLLALGSGVLAIGVGVVSAVSGTIIVTVLTLYFLATLDTMKATLYRLAPAYGRPKLAELTEQITASIGGYVAGSVTLSSCNATFSFVLLTILGVPYAVMLGFLSLLITTIPMIGPMLFWVLGTGVALLYSPSTALVFAIIYFIYMQFEAYWLTPKVMSRAVSVPGALVLIGAMIGATLLGLLGALVAVPVTASVLLILRSVFIPRQDAKVSPDGQIGLPAELPATRETT